jgi:hypothetical protein
MIIEVSFPTNNAVALVRRNIGYDPSTLAGPRLTANKSKRISTKNFGEKNPASGQVLIKNYSRGLGLSRLGLF